MAGFRFSETRTLQLIADVVVIGSGFAGLAAAIEATLADSPVVALEKMKSYDGNSVICNGFMAAAGTTIQEKEKIADSSELMAADMLRAGLVLNQPKLVRTVAESSAETLQ
jgi:succinate dehydrogenase/fumarate reductase flavoprotein subunit